MLCALGDTSQKPVPIHPLNKTSPGGLYPKLADLIMERRNLTETKLMTLGHQLENNVTQRIHLLVKPILELQEEIIQGDLELLKIRCKEDRA
jgi:hypothetical protein